MERWHFEQYYKKYIHHKAVFHMKDGGTVEGYMQPWDNDFVYTTDLDGKAGNKVKLSEINNVEFPDG